MTPGKPEAQRAIVAAIEDHARRTLADDIDLWPRVRQGIERQAVGGVHRPGKVHPKWRLGAAVLLGLIAGAGGLMGLTATSPVVRQALAASIAKVEPITAGIGMSADGNDVVDTPTSFRVANLGYIPAGLTIHQFSHLSGPGGWTASIGDAAQPSSIVPMPAGMKELMHEGVEAIYLRFSAPSPKTNYLEVLERGMPQARTLAPGQPIALAGTQATLHTDGSVAVIELDRLGTLITVRTTLGSEEAIRVGENLK